MAHNQNVLLPLQLENDRFESNNDVTVRLSTTVTVVELVVVAGVVVFGVVALWEARNQRCLASKTRRRKWRFERRSHPIAHPRIELIQTLPRQLLIRQLARGLDSPPQR
jgi:hypothetical protein